MSNKIFQIVKNTIPRLVQVVDGEFFDGDGNPLVFQGPQGPQGPTGFGSGTQSGGGSQGPQGFQGPQGPQGPAVGGGLTGPTGPQGLQGFQGPTGPINPWSEILLIGNTASVNVNMYGYGISDANFMDFYLTPSVSSQAGRLIWNSGYSTIEMGVNSEFSQLLGQVEVVKVVNKSGTNLLSASYSVMKVTDAQGQRLAVNFAIATSDTNSADTLGVVCENISVNQEGVIVTRGEIRKINTTGSLQGENWSEGDSLYLSPYVFGGITNIKPNAPLHLVRLGYVVYKHAINGKIYVKIDNGYELSELHDVYYGSTPSNGYVLAWNSTQSRWEPTQVVGPTGPQGFQGATGPQGFQGPTGPQGFQGFQGPDGPQGTNGTIGVNGATGSTGPQGATGPTNPAINLFLFYNY